MPFLEISPGGGKLTTTKSLVAAPGAPAAVRPLVVIGYASNTTDLPLATPTPFTTPGAVQSAGSTGGAVEQAAFALSPNGGVQTVHVVNAGGANVGEYGSITQTWAGSLDPVASGDAAVLPDDTFEVVIEFTEDSTLGVTGGKYRVSLDGGFSFFAERDLGTATSITLPNGGGKINLDPPLAGLLTYVNELVDDAADHFVEIAASVHGAADAGPYTIGAAAATQAAAITRFGQILTAAIAHVQVIAASVHGASDTTALTALNAITPPTTGQELLTAAIAFEAAFFGDGSTLNSGHTLRTASSIHGAADAVNVVAGAAASPGEITDGDTIEFSTTGPSPDATQIQNAIRSLRAYTGDFAAIVFSEPVTGALLQVIHDEIESLWDFAKFKDVIASFRPPNAGETVTQYRAALHTSLDAYSSTEIRVCSGAVRAFSALMPASGGGVRPLRPTSWFVGPARARSQPQTYLAFLPAAPGVAIKDSRGLVLSRCFDEQDGNLYSVENRTCGTRSDPQRLGGANGVFLTQDLLFYQADSPWILGPYTPVVNHLVESSQYFIKGASQAPGGYPSPPGEPLLDEIRKQIEADGQALIDGEGTQKGRNAEAQLVLDADAGLDGLLPFSLTVVPNNYPINGARLDVKLSAVSLTRAATASIGG
jgi:hypothetical protein